MVSSLQKEQILTQKQYENLPEYIQQYQQTKEKNIDGSQEEGNQKIKTQIQKYENRFTMLEKTKQTQNQKSSDDDGKIKITGVCLAEMDLDEQNHPTILTLLYNYFYENEEYLKPQGLLRKATSILDDQEFLKQLEQGNIQIISERDDPYIIANLIKKIFHTMPIPLFSFENYVVFKQLKEDEDEQVVKLIQEIVQNMDPLTVITLENLIKFLRVVASFQEENLMTEYNVSVCIMPTILKPKQYDMTDLAKQRFMVHIVELLLKNQDVIFSSEKSDQSKKNSENYENNKVDNDDDNNNNNEEIDDEEFFKQQLLQLRKSQRHDDANEDVDTEEEENLENPSDLKPFPKNATNDKKSNNNFNYRQSQAVYRDSNTVRESSLLDSQNMLQNKNHKYDIKVSHLSRDIDNYNCGGRQSQSRNFDQINILSRISQQSNNHQQDKEISEKKQVKSNIEQSKIQELFGSSLDIRKTK